MTAAVRPIIDQEFERLPPHDIDSEKAVLGSLMLCGIDNRELFDLTRSQLRREWFFIADHQVVFDVLCDLTDAGRPVDALIVRAELVRRQELANVGGAAYLGEIVNSVPDCRHGPTYAETVREKAILRGLIGLSNDLLRRCYGRSEGAGAVSEITRDYLGRLSDLTAESAVSKFVLLSDAAKERLSRKRDGDEQMVHTGIGSLDDAERGVGGIPKGKFTLVGGRPGSGKSLLCKQIVLNAAANGVSCGIVTVEETNDKIAENALSNLSGIENRKIAFGHLDEVEWGEIDRACAGLGELKIWLDDAAVKLAEVEESVTTAAVRYKCELVVVDYLQLIDPDQKGETENREITIISQSLKRLAKRLGIALIAACQLNRGNESQGIRKPTLRDLRGSGTLEQDGDLILLLHREDYYRYSEPGYQPTGQVECIVAKMKNGGNVVIPLKFSGRTQSITDWRGDPFATNVVQQERDIDPWTGHAI